MYTSVICILFLVVAPELGTSIPNHGRKVVGSRPSTSKCSSLGGSCMAPGMMKSFRGGSSTYCWGPQGCRGGLLCCKKQKLKTGTRSLPATRKKKNAPTRKIQCPPNTRCGAPVEGAVTGRCRKKCKAKEGEKDPDGQCPEGKNCKCCFRTRKCKTLKSCTKNGGTCKGECVLGETQLPKGCKNKCVCCVPPGGEAPPDPCVVCEAEGGACKKKCDESNGEREFTELVPDGSKKKCCLKDCYDWQCQLWYAHGEWWYEECDYGICKNGVIKTPGKRDPLCCTIDDHNFYYEDNDKFCAHADNGTEYFYQCKAGVTINLSVRPENCTEYLGREYVDEIDGRVVFKELTNEIKSNERTSVRAPCKTCCKGSNKRNALPVKKKVKKPKGR